MTHFFNSPASIQGVKKSWCILKETFKYVSGRVKKMRNVCDMLIRMYLIMQETWNLAEGDAIQSNLRKLQR